MVCGVRFMSSVPTTSVLTWDDGLSLDALGHFLRTEAPHAVKLLLFCIDASRMERSANDGSKSEAQVMEVRMCSICHKCRRVGCTSLRIFIQSRSSNLFVVATDFEVARDWVQIGAVVFTVCFCCCLDP